jgi:hypothetical protein
MKASDAKRNNTPPSTSSSEGAKVHNLGNLVRPRREMAIPVEHPGLLTGGSGTAVERGGGIGAGGVSQPATGGPLAATHPRKSLHGRACLRVAGITIAQIVLPSGTVCAHTVPQ